MASQPTGKKSHTGRNVVIGLVVFVAIVGFFLLSQGSVGRPATVTVSGTVSTRGIGTHPVSIGFTSDSGQVYNAAVVNGQYSTNLPNDHTYTAQVQWAGLLGASGACNAGSFSVSQGPGSSSLTNSWSC